MIKLALRLLGNEEQKQKLSNNIANLAIPDSAGVIAREILSSME